MQTAERLQAENVAEREITVSNIVIHIKSVFSEQRTLDDAMKNIIARRLAEIKK